MEQTERIFRMPSIHDRSSVEAFAEPAHDRVWLSVEQHLRRHPEDAPEDHEVCQAMTREVWHQLVGMLIAAGDSLGWLPHPEAVEVPAVERWGGYL